MTLLPGTSALLLLTFLLIGQARAQEEDDRFQWLTDLDEARELAAGESKPMLVVFRCEP